MTKAQVIALIDQYITTNGNEEITGAQTNSVMKALANQDLPFGEIINKPTTLSGYGITDAYTKGQSDGKYLLNTTDVLNGNLGVTGNGSFEQGKISTTTAGDRPGFAMVNNGNHLDGTSIRLVTSNQEWRILNTYQTLENGFAVRNINLGSNAIEIDAANNNATFTGAVVGNSHIIAKGGASPLELHGNGVGDANSNFMEFFESNGTVRQGYFGFTTGSSTMRMNNDVGGNQLELRVGNPENDLVYSNSNGARIVYHTGNLTLSTLGGVPNTRSILAGTGLTGGGNLSSNLTISFNTSWGDSRYALQSTQIITGNHLSGGGNLSTNRTLTVVPTVNQWIVDSQGNQRMYFGGTGAIQAAIFRSSASGQDFFFVDENNNTKVIIESDTGNVTATAFFESSDIRLKENIEPLNYGLNEVEKIDTHTWNWKNNNESDMGVIAQELEAILPELVKTDKEGYKSVNYTKLVPILINSIKELSNEIKALKNG